ncbi:MAG: tRNA preQ1(34) S-adenosylmethionine ribosyltransferase-isomerase QueA [Desulfovibrio sp.]|jgi:S-adenosylmethionine:tRNA ribosyltransferase-isomerase|nr:tRNA preQ1(34) S-adenosylmethionine ribosyltransferase-isomerase QueA [Desulfovibrio sp.]
MKPTARKRQNRHDADEADFSLIKYHFDLPPERIAQFPPENRGASRLLVMSRRGEFSPEHRRFEDLPDCLPENALLVANNARVLPARLLGRRHTGGRAEFLLLTPLPLVLERARQDVSRNAADNACCAEVSGLIRAGGRVRAGESLHFGAGLSITALEPASSGAWRALLVWQGDLAGSFAAAGRVPLPPYIKRPDDEEDAGRYQTVYAAPDKTGAVAAPTAGLHFTSAMREKLAADFEWAELTLYVGYGTFSPVRSEDIRGHRLHREYLELPEKAAHAVSLAKAEGRPVLAIGTTSARALEGVAELCGDVRPYAGMTDIFLYPGRKFRIADALLTNFHLPQSSLLMLVSAFAGRERVLAAYKEAVKKGYRFFSYGDAMLIR